MNFYIGGAATYNPVLRQEWRTPSLWSVRDSAPYLHDGRAVTLDDVIRPHGGETQFTAQAFRSLRKEDRRCIILFFMTLAALLAPHRRRLAI